MKTCPFCAEEIQDAAIVCKHCGRDLASGSVPGRVADQPTAPSNGIAAVLSLVIPGAGQMYKGQVGQGLIWFVAMIAGYVMLIIPGLVLHLVCILSAGTSSSKGTPTTGVRTPPPDQPRTPEQRAAAASGLRRFAGILGIGLALAVAVTLVVNYTTSAPSSATGRAELVTRSSGNRAHDAIMRLPVPARSTALGKSLAGDRDLPCDRVTRTFFAGLQASTHDAFWSVACNDGHSYQITVKGDAHGTTRVLSCGTLKAVANVECFTTLSSP